MADKPLHIGSDGNPIEVEATVVSAGAANAGEIPGLNASGVLDPSIVNATTVSSPNQIPILDGAGKLPAGMLPTGVGPDTKAIATSETLAAGNIVNVWDNTGSAVRKADATTSGKPAVGFVLAAFTHPTTATVYFEGTITGLSGLTIGATYFLGTTAGAITATPPTGSGNIVQRVGVAISATELSFEPGDVYVRA